MRPPIGRAGSAGGAGPGGPAVRGGATPAEVSGGPPDPHAAGPWTALIHRPERGRGQGPRAAGPVPRTSMTADVPAWLRLVGLNAACALGVALLVTVILGVGPFVPTLVIALLYANAIGIPAALILPAPLACHRGPGWRQWAVLTGGLLVVGAGGSLVAAGAAVGLGLVPGVALRSLLAEGLALAVAVTLGVGITAFVTRRGSGWSGRRWRCGRRRRTGSGPSGWRWRPGWPRWSRIWSRTF